MTKKKIIWAFALIVCLIIPAMLTLTACGGNKNGNNEKVDKLETASGVVASVEFSKSDNLVCNAVDVTSQEGQTAIAKIIVLDYNAKKMFIFMIFI